MSAGDAMSGSVPAAGAAAASSQNDEKGNSLWNILPSFDPQVDDPREYKDKVLFLHGICPKKDRAMLAPRLAMMMKGTAWAQVKQLDTEQLLDPEKGIKVLLSAISKWEEAEEMQLYDKFEKALYRTTQRSDETTQSYVNRMAVSFHELGTLTVKDIQAFILLRQSAVSVEDKKRVLTMAGNPLVPEKVEQAMRQLSTKVLVGQADGKRKVYPVNYLEDDAEEVNFTAEGDGWDEDLAIAYLADHGDEEAQLIKDFEDQLIEVCQENQDLALCYTSYADARAKIRDRLRHRGFWPSSGGKGRGKFGKKGGKPDLGKFHKKKESLAERIAASNCRRCGQRGHWKWECPQREGAKEDVNMAVEVLTTMEDKEILDSLPDGVRGSDTIDELFKNFANQDKQGSAASFAGIVCNSTVNDEFMETALVCSLERQKGKGHCLGRALVGAMSRRVECEKKSNNGSQAIGCPGIVDTGASKTVIGQRKVKALIQSMPLEIQNQMNWKKSETMFRFGNNAVLPSVGALYLPFGSRWMRIEVVEGDTPFLLSNSFLRAIDANVCIRNSSLRLNQLDIEVPLIVNPKGLFMVQLADVIAAFSREHTNHQCEVVTNVITEHHQQQPQQPITSWTAADVAQSTSSRTRTLNVGENNDQSRHGEPEGEGSLCLAPGPASSISGRPRDDIHDHDRGGKDLSPSRRSELAPVGTDDDGGGQAQGQDLRRSHRERQRLLQLDEETSQAFKRLGHLVSELCESLGYDSAERSEPKGCAEAQGIGITEEDAPSWGVERGGRVGDDREGGNAVRYVGQADDVYVVGTSEEADQGREQGQDGGGGGSRFGAELADADCGPAGSIGSHHQEHQRLSREANESKENQNVSRSCDKASNKPTQNDQVLHGVHETLCHLEVVSRQIETELNEIMMVTSGEKVTRGAQRAQGRPCHLDLLEVYCEDDSNLTKVFSDLGMKAKRFTRKDGDLSTQEGQAKLWRMIEEEQPLNIWMAPECKYWGNFSRWNSGRNPATAAKIQAGRQREKGHLKLCTEVFWHQVSLGRHFHLEQPQGSEAVEQKELGDIVDGTYRTVFDMCEAGQLKVPRGNNYLRKRTIVLTTSKEFHSLLDARYCRKGHEHRPILGQAYINGRWQNLSAFAAKYSKGFAKNVAFALSTSKHLKECPVTLEELLVPCFGVRAAEQQEIAEQIVKRRKYSHKQEPRLGEEELPAIPSNLSYGPAPTWRSIFKSIGNLAPRVGTMVIDPEGDLFRRVAQQVDQFRTLHVEICRD